MNRRALLKAGTLFSLGGSGCASVLSGPSLSGGPSLGDFLAGIDAMRDAVGRADVFAAFRDPARPELDAEVDARAELTRKTFRSLLLAGALSEVPAEQRSHVEVTRRLAASMNEMDDAMFGMTSVLEDLPSMQRADLGRALRDDPQLSMRILGDVDREAVALGVPFGVRTRMRSVGAHVSSRLRVSTDLTLTDCTGKFRKLEARHGAQAEAERKAATALTSALFWSQADDAAQPAVGGTVAEAPSAQLCSRDEDCAPAQHCTDFRELGDGEWTQGVCRPRTKIRRSPVLLGVGAASLGVGALVALPFASMGLSFAPLITLGAVIALSGLIVLIVGLANAAKEK